ncbi:radical SAM protein [Helicobacter saguini]|uniref:Radical SAM/SPASM domain-containing protein n=2 Tax=Helicobacter saguini TaxID=1548018 RepID=A0A4V6I1Z9_9HELI|nr:radical SAM protein [Helicobacter saguini]MWV66836.1 radical SAM protein [Helicobacter saguini]TLD94222.1 radical SAM/SPASM domain-containing protein [Helicobacter saguini]
MEILRAKTKELFKTKLTKEQEANSALNIAEIESGATILKSYPRRIVLEMTSACNIKCIFCGRDEAEFNQTYLKLDVLDKLENVLKVCEEVTLFGWGEPTINPNFSKFLERLNKTNVRKYFVSNGTRLNHFVDDIFRHKVDIIAVSLDGPSGSVNDNIRVGAKFDRVIENIKAIQARKKELGVDFPYMNFVFVAMERNIRELPKMVKLAHSLNMQEVKVVFLTAFSQDMLKEVLYNKQDLIRQVFNDTIKVAVDLGIKLKLPYIQGEDIAGDKYHKDCFTPWRDFFIGSDDSIRPCQSTSLKLAKFSDYEKFEDVWNNEAFQKIRKEVNMNVASNGYSMPIQCKLCYQSSHANWNRKESFIQVGQAFAPDWESMKKDSKKVATIDTGGGGGNTL